MKVSEGETCAGVQVLRGNSRLAWIEGVQGLRITFVNVFSIRHASGGWTLVDAGVPFSQKAIRSWAKREFHEGPRAIVLTHGHFDHVSAARGLAEEWNVPIYAHQLEFPYLTGQKEYPAPNAGAGGGLMSLLSPIYPRKPIDLGDRLRPLTELEGWEIVHTPGHTPGHVSLFCTTKPESFFEVALAQQPELHGPPSYLTSYWEAARRSVQRLAELHPSVVAPGHGKALSGSAMAPGLEKLAAHFDEIAVPENRKVGV